MSANNLSPEERELAGTRDNRRGQRWQRDAAEWLRETGLYPEARPVGQFPGEPWKADLDGTGPRVVEATLVDWPLMPRKLRQAERAAAAQKVSEAWVWRKVKRGPHESGQVADSLMIARAETVWALMAELDQLRAFAASQPGPWAVWQGSWRNSGAA